MNQYRSRPIRLLELGLAVGGPEVGGPVDRNVDSPSLRMWLEYFPFAQIYGFDISDFSHIQHPRFKFVRGDGGSPADMGRLANASPGFTIIVDDGSHASYHQQLAFKYLFPRLAPGGLYVIEDLHWQSPHYEASLPAVPKTGYFLKLYFEDHVRVENSLLDEGTMAAIGATVEAFSCFPSFSDVPNPVQLIVIRKRDHSARLKAKQTIDTNFARITMPGQDWIKSAFRDGYSSGDLTLMEPDPTTRHEEEKIGGSYRRVLETAVVPFLTPNSRVLEIGPGAGSWTRALLNYTPEGEVHTLDFVDFTELLKPNEYKNRLYCHTITDTNYDFLPNDFFDFLFSFGVMCHTMAAERHNILRRALPKMRARAYSVHQYGDWSKLEHWGWERGHIPSEFKRLPDDQIWWPRNDSSAMAATARAAGWRVVTPDMDLLDRDGLILLCRPE